MAVKVEEAVAEKESDLTVSVNTASETTVEGVDFDGATDVVAECSEVETKV